MALVLRMLYHELKYYMEDCKDRRIEHYFLMGSPIKVLSIIALYLYFIYVWGPKFMEKRRPYELKNILIVYNLAQVIINFIIGTLGFKVFCNYIGNLDCVPVNYSPDETGEGLYQAKLSYTYYLIKIIDLLDTVFFVLRKKYNQVTFLHVYHHATMVLGTYLFTQYMPGGQFGYLGIVNSYVHTVMYFYYFLTAFKPELKKSIWWKKHITQIQIIQFASIIYFFVRPFFATNCPLPKFWLIFLIIQNAFMLIMFGDFYFKAYIKKHK